MPSAWAPAGKGKGALAPWKCCKVFCALEVTVKRSVHQLFIYALFSQFFEGRSGSVVQRRLKKDRPIF